MTDDGADIHAMPGHLVRRLHQISVSVFTDAVSSAGFDVTSVQFAALCMVERHPGLDQATLAGLIAYDRVTLGGVVDRLEHKGLVRRVVNTRDRRARALHLTSSGAVMLAQLKPVVLAVQQEILQGLSRAEQQEFMRLLDKLTRAGNARSRAPLAAHPAP